MKKFSVALCGGVSLLAVAPAAFAQQTTTTTAPAAPAAPAAAPAATQEVVITGSRIVRNGYSAPTPVTVATTAELTATTPSNIPDGLNKLPVFAGSTTTAGTTNAVGGSGGGVAVTSGGNYLNLRDMGAIRTLVLLDGSRVAPTALNGTVDTNTLPEMLVQRVDVVTGGASAVYGSDAVTGVVNFVLDKNFNGLKVFGQVGDSTYGDARSYRYGIAGGGELGDRTHVIWSFEQYQNNGIDSHDDRPWSADNPDYVGKGTVASPFTLVTNARLNNATLGGLATSGPLGLNGQQFTNSGLAAFNPGSPTASSTISTGGQGASYTGLNLVPPINTIQAFGRVDYDLTDNVKAYVQLSDSEDKVWNSQSNSAPATPATIFSGNPYLPTTAQSALTTAGASSFTFSRLNRDLANMSSTNQMTDALTVKVGVTGKTFGDFTWDAYYNHGTSIIRDETQNNIYYPNYYAALDAVTGPNGQPACRVTITNPGLYPGCQPINMFGTNNQSAASLAYIFQNTEWQAVSTMDDFAASLSGDAFNDWAGPVSTAFNMEYRAQSLSETTNANPLAIQPNVTYKTVQTPQGPIQIPASYVGQSAEVSPSPTSPVAVPSTLYAYATQAPQYGANNVWEVSGETVVPLVKDMPFVKALDATGAVRYTDYSTSGIAVTWKAGFNYQPINDLRIRFTQSHDMRAPTLYDLYAGTGVTQIALNDPVSGKTQVVTQITSGNPALKPEVSDTTTVGFVYSPSWLPRFKMSVDYYNINMTNVISSINGANSQILAQCQASGGTSPVCSSIIRSTPTAFPTYVTNYSANLAQVYTHGIDFEASYNFMLGDVIKDAPGRFDLRLLYSYQPVLNSVNNPGAPVIQLAGVAGMSADRVTTDVTYRIGPVSVDYEMRWLSSQNLSGTPLLVYAGPPLPAIFYHDINLTYRFRAMGHDGQLFFVVDNLLNQYPRISPSTSFSSIPGFGSPYVTGDDPVGRYFTLGFRAQY